MYIGFGTCPICSYYAAEILQNPKWRKGKKIKIKIFIRDLNKQYGFASQDFLVVRGNS